MEVSYNRGTPKSSILMGCSILYHLFFGAFPFMETSIWWFNYEKSWFFEMMVMIDMVCLWKKIHRSPSIDNDYYQKGWFHDHIHVDFIGFYHSTISGVLIRLRHCPFTESKHRKVLTRQPCCLFFRKETGHGSEGMCSRVPDDHSSQGKWV